MVPVTTDAASDPVPPDTARPPPRRRALSCARIRLAHACSRADSSTGARFPAPPTNHPPSRHPPDRLNPNTPPIRRTDREHDLSLRRFGPTGPSHRTACPGTPTARTARSTRRPRAARVEPSPGRAPQPRRGAPASSVRGTRESCTRRAVPSRHARHPAGLIAMGTPITEPPRLLPDSMGKRPAGASAAYGGVESAPADQVAALSSSPSWPSALRSRRRRRHPVGRLRLVHAECDVEQAHALQAGNLRRAGTSAPHRSSRRPRCGALRRQPSRGRPRASHTAAPCPNDASPRARPSCRSRAVDRRMPRSRSPRRSRASPPPPDAPTPRCRRPEASIPTARARSSGRAGSLRPG